MMTDKSDVWLHSVSVVILAKYHNPSILNNDFLVSEDIVPNGWQVKETVTTPAVSILKYSNGVRWTVDQDRLIIIEDCDLPFQQNDENKVHKLASAYIEKLQHTPYRSLGLNCRVSILHKNPIQWITEQFLKKSLHSHELFMLPRFTMNVDDATLSLQFDAGWAIRNRIKNTSSVLIDCNLHYNGPFDSASLLQNKISQWVKSKNIISSQLDKILGGS